MTLPASLFVNVNPGVLGAGGTGLSLNGLLLTTSTRLPIGVVQSFPNLASVVAYFGAGSAEALKAAVYFKAFDTSTIKPGAYLITQYPWSAPVAAWLRGGSVANLTLAQLGALSGTLTVTVDGVAHTSSAITLTSTPSFTAAAATIQTALAASDFVGTGSISAYTMTISAVTSGTLAVGQAITGTGVSPGTYVTALVGGTGGTGTYTVNISQTVAGSTTLTGGAVSVTYDSTSGAFVVTCGSTGATSTIGFGSGTISAGLMLTQATGAVLSQGADIAVPGAFMAALAVKNQNWATFTTAFEPVAADGVLFAAWTNSTNGRFGFIAWDTDATVASGASTTCLGYLIKQAAYSGTMLVYQPSDLYAADFMSGMVAAIDFPATNGRITLAFKGQSGLTPGVTDSLTYANVVGNGYSCYVSAATAATQFNFLASGSVSGQFDWADTYVNQIWLNAALQLAMMSLLTAVNSIPYNASGYALIAAACADPIQAALNAGVIRTGVTLSSLQQSEINTAAGLNIASTISTRGWYLQIQPASAITRVARTSPPMTLWYSDGESVQQLTLASIVVQ